LPRLGKPELTKGAITTTAAAAARRNKFQHLETTIDSHFVAKTNRTTSNAPAPREQSSLKYGLGKLGQHKKNTKNEVARVTLYFTTTM